MTVVQFLNTVTVEDILVGLIAFSVTSIIVSLLGLWASHAFMKKVLKDIEKGGGK